ncbi:hypothetical protein ARMSODRAFT_313092 [Armillaria solidipes]|uniref:Secreted protein n=1 Tax=Armillaria solidipes TaxID=1076256 RepID=A0A2H3BWV1_9AGAR|nr:hypothetical protein ARMSODRAFT_313092 [Armillaria solidipes]
MTCCFRSFVILIPLPTFIPCSPSVYNRSSSTSRATTPESANDLHSISRLPIYNITLISQTSHVTQRPCSMTVFRRLSRD